MKQWFKSKLPAIYGAYLNNLVLLSPKKAAKKAFKIFCKIRKGRVLPPQQSFLEHAKLNIESIKDHQIQSYNWPGDCENVLLVHGWESNTYRWRNLIGYLKKGNYNVIAFDAPGHGYSSGKYLHVPLYTDCLNHMVHTYKPDYIIAHSVGGMTTIYQQNKYPDAYVKGIITIGSPSEFHEIMEQYKIILGLSDTLMQSLDAFILEEFGFTIREFSTSHFVKTNTKKGLLIHDRQDAIAPFHASEQVNANWENSQLIATEGLGHSMHQKQVNEWILDFLESLK